MIKFQNDSTTVVRNNKLVKILSTIVHISSNLIIEIEILDSAISVPNFMEINA